MELRQYWHVIWKRIWIMGALLVIVAGISFATYQAPAVNYSSQMRFTVAVKSQANADEYSFDGYYAWISSEYLIDNLTSIVSSADFANDVNMYLEQVGSGVRIPKGIIHSSREHRILTVTANWGNAAELGQISQAIVQAVATDSVKYFPQLETVDTPITLIDTPSPPFAAPPTLTQRLDIPIRLVLAVMAGLALIFLLDYLDTSVRNAQELEAMAIPVLAELPKHK
ncbi:MAG: hypothetical protein AAF629_25415 [Chloroflexota bacterium]